ncbi:MAG: DUF5060 domain-containing protein [Fibrobacteria bacterium]|nr:DUF5060 domain-containing protein [Fibrobacteria bacterium]
MFRHIKILSGICFLLTSLQIYAADISGFLKKWHRVTVSFQGPESNELSQNVNPFLDYRLQVLFSGPGGKLYDVPGFFDGDGVGNGTGNIWKVHFTPDEEGEWSYTASFRVGANVAVDLDSAAGIPTAFNGESGTFLITSLDKNAPGFLKWGRLQLAGGHYFKFADGPYFIKGGTDSPENFLSYSGFDNTAEGLHGIHSFSEHIQDWETGDPDWGDGKGKGIVGALNYLSSRKVNSLYALLMNIGGDGQDVWPFAGEINKAGSISNDNLHYDISKLSQWEIVFDHAQKKGIHLHLLFNEAEAPNKTELDDGILGTERKLFYREMIARFGHHNAVTWNISEEYDAGHAYTPGLVKSFANYIKLIHPYGALITVHNAGLPETVWGPFVGDSNFSIMSLQTKDLTQLEKLRTASLNSGWPIPVAIDEVYPEGLREGSENLHRKWFTWPILLSGGYIEYISSELLRTEDFRKYEQYWIDLGHARSFMQDNLPFWEMVPCDNLLSGTASFPVNSGVPIGGQVFCKEGDIYAVYLPDASLSGTLDLSGKAGTFGQKWFNPRSGSFEGATVEWSGDREVVLGIPPSGDSDDWVVFIKNKVYELPSVVKEQNYFQAQKINENSSSLFLRGNKLYLLKNAKVYTLQGTLVQ